MRTAVDIKVDWQRERRMRTALRTLILNSPDFAHSPVIDTLATTDGLLVTLASGEKYLIRVDNKSRV